jgi:hypothetical protein
MAEDKFIEILLNKRVNITEENVLERLLDRFRWPIQYPWGQPSVEAINKDGSKHQDFFYRDGYIDSENVLKLMKMGTL